MKPEVRGCAVGTLGVPGFNRREAQPPIKEDEAENNLHELKPGLHIASMKLLSSFFVKLNMLMYEVYHIDKP